jgi:hypothetical protein
LVIAHAPTAEANYSFLANHNSFQASGRSFMTTGCSSAVCLSVELRSHAAWVTSRGKVAPSVIFDNQRHLRTRSHTVASQLLVIGRYLVLFEDRIAGLVDGKQVWIDGVTLGVAHAFRLLETNPHKASSPDGSENVPDRT